jgi:RimJ/RimL family protein N-acetyltransferase
MIAFRKIQRNLQDYGLGITVRKALMYFVRWLYFARDYRIYRADLGALSLPTLVIGSLVYRWITHEDVDLIRQIEAMEEWLLGKVAPKLTAGGLCLIAADGDKLAGFNLVGFGHLHLYAIRMYRTFRPDCAWSEQISVSPDFRGQGVASELRHRVFAELRRRGIKRFYGGTMTDNTASLKLARRVGFREIVDIRFRKRFGIPSWRYVKLQRSP